MSRMTLLAGLALAAATLHGPARADSTAKPGP